MKGVHAPSDLLLLQSSHQLTIDQRAAAFRWRYPHNKAAWPWVSTEDHRRVLYGWWVIGNDYRNKSGYYGAYPPTLVDRILALFPEATNQTAIDPEIKLLHAFSGSLQASERYIRLDMGSKVNAELKCNVYDVGSVRDSTYQGAFDLVIADPPYTPRDALHYETPAVNRGRATRALAAIVRPGGHLVWLDTCWPMHTKTLWHTVGRIAVQRSTNHRLRGLYLFQRQ